MSILDKLKNQNKAKKERSPNLSPKEKFQYV